MRDSPSILLAAEDSRVGLASEADGMQVGYQTWNQNNLCVESYHEDIFVLHLEMGCLVPLHRCHARDVANGGQAFHRLCGTPESPYGVPINDKYGLVDVAAEGFWTEPRRQRKFKELEKLCKRFTVTESVVPGHALSIQNVYEMGACTLMPTTFTLKRWQVLWTTFKIWMF